MTYEQWCEKHPIAARELATVFEAQKILPGPIISERSEAWAQQQTRFHIARQGAYSWRNNVGATPAKCPSCGARRQPVRYGLANESAQQNKEMKSSDLILAIPRRIEPRHVGTVIAQFGAIECKRPSWNYSGTREEQAQLAWLAHVCRIGGFSKFSQGEIKL